MIKSSNRLVLYHHYYIFKNSRKWYYDDMMDKCTKHSSYVYLKINYTI